jgi:ATP-binding cassette, subfamily B, bacterial MsbA
MAMLRSESTKNEQRKGVYRRLLGYLHPYRKTFASSIGAMVVYGATDGAIPFILKHVLDDVFGAKNSEKLFTLVLLIAGFAILRGFFGFLQHYLSSRVGLAIVRDLRNELAGKLLTLSPSFFLRHNTGSLISRMTNDTLLIRSALTDAASAIMKDSVRVIGLLVVAFALDPVLAAITLIGLPLALGPMVKFGRRVRKLSRTGQDSIGQLTDVLNEIVQGTKVIQSFTMEDREHLRFKEQNEKLTGTFLKAEKYGALSGPTNEVVASVAIGAVILYGGYMVLSGVRTQGDFIAFITSMLLLYDPLKRIGRVNTIVQAGASAAERLFEVLDEPSDIEEETDAIPLPKVAPRVVFEDVSFSYAREQSAAPDVSVQWVLKNINLTVDAGETVALVGMSGGGKSTLVNLLPRFFDPQSGRITIGGLEIRSLTVKSLRKSIAMVAQHTFLFNASIRENIAYGDPEAGTEQIRDAARAAYADSFITQLPNGYDTVVGEQGFRLSGGERARIAIARALLKNAPILVLDEATAALDSEAEKVVQSAIDRLMQGRTVLVIAHRLATIRRASKIAVLSRGQIVELGSHNELLARNGEYAKLYTLQFRDQEDDERYAAEG